MHACLIIKLLSLDCISFMIGCHKSYNESAVAIYIASYAQAEIDCEFF